MRSSFRLGKLIGIPIGINHSWFLVFVIVTVSLAFQLSEDYPLWSPVTCWSVGVVASLLLFGSVLVHELSHSLLAIRMGLPVHGITLFIFGGVSHISREASRPGMEAAIAFVGPLTSLTLAGFSFGLAALVAPISQQISAIFNLLWQANLVLGIFNLVPGFPLDGGRVFRAIAWAISGSYAAATRLSIVVGRIIAFAIIIAGIAITLWTGSFQGLWLALIGWFLWQAASATYHQFHIRESRIQGSGSNDL